MSKLTPTRPKLPRKNNQSTHRSANDYSAKHRNKKSRETNKNTKTSKKRNKQTNKNRQTETEKE